jgi:dipeptidyl aminopeptidase/acylaminoacyl peptidase
VTASKDGTARLWDATNGKEIGVPMQHREMVNSVQFSPDGQRVVTASKDGTARLWDATNGKEMSVLMKHPFSIISAQFSPDGLRVVTVSSADRTARLWDVVTDKEIGVPMQHGGLVKSAQFSPDGLRVVTASEDGTARLWDAASGKAIGEPMNHGSAVRSAQFSPDGLRVATASEDGTARLWDASGKEIGVPMKHRDVVSSAQFSPDGLRVVTASWDGTARLWDVPTISSKDTAEDLLLLADLAEATGGVALHASGQAEIRNVLIPEQIRATREKIAAKFPGPSSKWTPLQRFLKWSVSEWRTRTISLFAELTVDKWVENRITAGIPDDLRAAIQVDPANARLVAHFGRSLAGYALEEGIDLDKACRARAEADFQTRRALKFAPKNDEVNNLRDEVVKLLQLSAEY